MLPDDEFRLSPAWRHALAILIERGLPYGTVIEKEELSGLFGMAPPKTAEDQEEFQLAFMRQFGSLRDELLEEHRLALKTMYGERSYQVIAPREQTGHAEAEALKEMRRATRKLVRTLAYVRHEELTDDERRKNADAQAKAAMLAGMIRRPALPAK